ncbi:MAG: hypothetical protein AUF65_01680 [Chloroflexi bacterium 13_1_20CM_50_12]|nr:MAG: hypothetical protein AUF65_01680 [Chloroflexi bacterium 13_1_20CM_50_12]
MSKWDATKTYVGAMWNELYTWRWTTRLFYWMLSSAGTMAELIFLIASVWMSINFSIHGFVRFFLPEDATQFLTGIANTAYIGLPECVAFLGVCVAIEKFRLWWYDRRDYATLTWFILYAVPMIIFIGVTVYTIGSSVDAYTRSNTFAIADVQLPPWLVVTRAITGYLFGFIAFLHAKLATPQIAEKLRKKDKQVAEWIDKNGQLEEHSSNLKAEMEERVSGLLAEIESLNLALAASKNATKRAFEELEKTDDAALQAYSNECFEWLKSGIKTTSMDDIIRYTGHPKRKIEKANLAHSPRNQDLILVSSLVMWLKNTPPPAMKREIKPTLTLVTEEVS